MPSKFQFITELYEKTLSELTDKPENWTGFLRAACFNYKCPFDEQVLIYAQRPDATAVLELDKWNKQFKRWINKGAHGIAVFADDKGNGRLKYYFDVSDTHTSHHSIPLPIWEMDMRYEGEVIEALENTFGDLKNKKTLVEAIFSASNNAVADNISDYLHDLKSCVEDSFLEELDELNIAAEYRQLLETSVAYMLLTRLSIDADDYITREDFVNLNDFNTLPTINALGIATGDIAEMGLREISRTVISLRKAQFFENNGKEPYDNATEEINIDEERGNDYGSDLQDRGRLQDAQPLDATAAGSSSGQVRGATQTVSDEAPQSALHEPQDDSQADGTSGGNRETGDDDDRAGNLEDGSDRRRDGEPEADQSNEVDRPYEQLPTFNGGNSLERPDLQLNVTDEAGGKNELPAFLNEHLIQAIVLDDGGRTVKRQEIFGYFQSHKDYKQRCEFLKNAYTETYVEILVDETRIGYKKQENGLLMWEGSYLSKTSASVFSWAIITEITENLIERGEYKIQLGLQNMPSVTEQLALFDMGGNVPVYEIDGSEPVLSLFPEKAIPQEVVDRALYTAGNQNGSVLRVVVQYMRERPEEENLAFLRREFGKNNGRGIEYDGHKYAVWFTEDGIRFAEGNSVRTGRSRTTVSWEDCSKRILELLYDGRYVSQSELDSAYETVLKSCADGLIYIARDLSDEGKEQSLFPIVRSIYEQKMGFPDCSESLAVYMQEGNGISEISKEYWEFLKAYEENREISRFRVSPYNTHRIDLILGGADARDREFAAQPSFIRQCKMFITHDEIEQYFLSGSKDSRLDTYSHFCLYHTPKEKQDFFKSDFGSNCGGCSDGYSYSKSGKGLTYERSYGRKTYETVQLTFSQIIRLYDQMIAQQRFPGEDALAYIPEYQAHQVARSIYAAFYGVPDDVPRPYPAKSDYYDGVPAIEKQLSDSARVQEILTTIKSIVDNTESGDRYYETRASAQTVLSEYAAGIYDLFNGKHPELTAPRKENRTAEEHQKSLTTEYGSLFVSKVLFDEPYMTIREGFADDEASRKACGEAIQRVAQTYSNDMRFTEFLAMTEWSVIDVLTDYAFDKTYMDFVNKFGREEAQESEYLSLAPSTDAAADAYNRYKADNPDYLVAIQMGAFYELYGDDAEKASKILGTTLLTRKFSYATVSMTGFPDNMWQSYSKELWRRGNSVLLIGQDTDGSYHIVKEHRAEMYIPVGTRLDIEGRRFEVEKVDFLYDKVSLRDVTFENAVGFPISRIEPIEFVRSYYEEQLPQIIESSIDNDSYLNSEIASFTDTWHEQISQEQSLAPPAPRTKTQSISVAPLDSNGANFSINNDQLGIGSAKEKFQRNIEAIEILNRVELNDSLATPEEQEILSKYVGWGGLSDAFDENKSAWASEYLTLRDTLSAEEYTLARESSLTAFYTPPFVIKSIYKAIENMGFSQGNILEPSCGTGNFFGMLPDSMAESKLYGVELDSISGRIAKQLYQKASIAVQGFEKADIPDSFFDVVIGNVPFGQFKVADKRYDKHNFLIHDYFFAKALDKVRPGGVVVFITSKGTLDKENPAVRKYIAQRADLLGAIRLPNTTFKANAGTEVTSDIILLQKKDRLIDIEPDWVHLGTDENGIKMNQYFIDNPGMLMGEMQMISGPFGPESACVPYEGQSLENMLSDAVQYLHGEITDYERNASYICRRVVRSIEITGQYDEAETMNIVKAISNPGLNDIDIQVDAVYFSERKIQLRQTFSVTLSASYKITILQLGNEPLELSLPIRVRVAGMSEVYWKQ